MIKNDESMKETPTQNTGKSKEYSAYEVGISRLLICDNQRQLRGDFILNLDDAHTCYNQMQHFLPLKKMGRG